MNGIIFLMFILVVKIVNLIEYFVKLFFWIELINLWILEFNWLIGLLFIEFEVFRIKI